MTYSVFVNSFVHPFIIYGLTGTVISYAIALFLVRLKVFNDSRSRALLFAIPFFVPFISFAVYKVFLNSGCYVAGYPWGFVQKWTCSAGGILASVFTPFVIVISALAVAKALLSLLAARRIIKKSGYVTAGKHPRLFSVLVSLCGKSGIRVPAVVVTGDRFARAYTMGWRSPVLVLSEGLLDSLDDEELETVVAHEIGHIKRGDSLLTWFMVFLRDLMFFNPLCYWIFKHFVSEKEMAADDFAVKLTNRPMAFGQALIKVWRLSPRGFLDRILMDNLVHQAHFASDAGIIGNRVERILNDEHKVANRSGFLYLAILPVMLLPVAMLYVLC
ncbi:MAG: hypothetical protein CVU89_12355 [Firmicutes bacterium HGW-Firmicutes-14]|nr:MAG: hypothetical protein CVU89_12355 [Firmicutes bacterium HGW-Firmicutes-14]